MVKLIIEKNEGGQRLDRFLKKYLRNASLSHIYKLIRKDLKVNGKRAKVESMLEEGDELTFYISQEQFDEYTRVKRKPGAKAKKQSIIRSQHRIPTGAMHCGIWQNQLLKRCLGNQMLLVNPQKFSTHFVYLLTVPRFSLSARPVSYCDSTE